MVARPQHDPIGEYAELLREVELFAGLDRVTLSKLAGRLEPMVLQPGATLIRQGDPPGDFYLISRGVFGIYVAAHGGRERRLSGVTRGDPIGEMALLTGESRSATVRAESDGEVLRLRRGEFLGLVQQDPSVPLAIAVTLSRRLRAGEVLWFDSLEQIPPTIDDPDVDEALEEILPPAHGAQSRPRGWIYRRLKPSRSLVGLALAALALAIGWMLPPPPGLSTAGLHALASVVALVALLAFESLPDGPVALTLVGIWAVGGIVPPAVALNGFATTAWLMIVSIFVVAATIASTGVFYRIALSAIRVAGTGFDRQAVMLGLAGLGVSTVIPNPTGRVSFMAPMVAEIAEALGHAPKSRAAAGLAMAVLVGFGLMAAPFLTSSSTGLVVYAVLLQQPHLEVDWGSWALRAGPTHLILFVGLLSVVLWRYRPPKEESADRVLERQEREALALQAALLGTPSVAERIALGTIAFLLLGFVTQPLHRLDPAWVAVAAFGILGAAGAITPDALRAVNWHFVLLFGVLSGMAQVLATTGLDQWLASFARGIVSGLVQMPVLFVGCLAVVCLALSLVLRWQAAAPLLTLALGPVAHGSGIDPWVIAIVALVACNTFFLPYQSTIYLALYHGTGGHLFSHAQARPVAYAYAVLAIVSLCASVPLWHLAGLL